MALRSQTTTVALLSLLTVTAGSAADPLTFAARHRHLRKGGMGEMRITDSSVSFREAGKKKEHAWEWKYEDIQELFLSAGSLRVRTYADDSWKLGRDREYEFDTLPEGIVLAASDFLRPRMEPRRFIVAMGDSSIQPLWQVKAKLREGFGGSEGVVLVSQDMIVYKSEEPDASRSWRIDDIDNISSSGPFDLTITTFELDKSRYGDRREFRFQLKESLSQSRYNALWLRLNQSRIKSKENYHE